MKFVARSRIWSEEQGKQLQGVVRRAHYKSGLVSVVSLAHFELGSGGAVFPGAKYARSEKLDWDIDLIADTMVDIVAVEQLGLDQNLNKEVRLDARYEHSSCCLYMGLWYSVPQEAVL